MLNGSPFPWLLYSVSGQGTNDYTSTFNVQANLSTWQSKTGRDLNSVKFDKDPTTVILPGDVETLQQKIQNQEPIPPSVIQAYFTLFSQ